MRRLFIMTSLGALALLTTGCARRDPIQTDRTAFTFDSTYQRNTYSQPIEATFDRTVTVFREAGYTLDLVDRATGQISGRRGKTGDKGAKSTADMRFYAIILPGTGNGSQLALKFVQVANVGVPLLNGAKAEVIMSQPELYAYVFRRVNGATPTGASSGLSPAAPSEATDNVNSDLSPFDPTGGPR
jgi:hypothetical protein